MIKKVILYLSTMALCLPLPVAAQTLEKVRGPFDKYRQFTSHFEFSVPQDISVVRDCVLDEIKASAAARSEPVPAFKVKSSKRKDGLSEKYTWKTKTMSGYTLENEVSFDAGEGWTHVDTDLVYETYDATGAINPERGGLVGMHTRCGRADDIAAPVGMPRTPAWSADKQDIALSASSPKSLYETIECAKVYDDDVGGGRISNTFEADHLGSFYGYYIVNYDNLGTTQRLFYALKVTPEGTGTKLEILTPGVAVQSNDPAKLRSSIYAVNQIAACGGIFDPSAKP